ncbi:hypothetical protein GCM10011583_12010 [Streptomyces camponoticapitis]|uniref:HK97 gp10 family phage protein n=1 Tax=Streptomyces camponoticapitis TaxID=1616125 RepID=A0ABQ2DZV8_9ACTN|nr:minor capsid protein [Streptomyces camponoticapitis]GGJ82056.1 hypothetical protein GCM10011583_12010 [Streptomyces camponoticapitis]
MPRYRLTVNTTAVRRELRAAAARGLLLAAEHVLGESTAVVPLDEAALSRSGTVSVDEPTLTAAISYDTPYAIKQHEELNFQHAPGRTAKYLEGPLNASTAQVRDIVAAQLRRAMR